ncbi:hypothetical protein JXO52_11230 [bacterium]|nr:hypothetical protein [bacterium]
MKETADQLEMFPVEPDVVHYFDRNGALRSGRFVRMITRGKKKGQLVVRDAHGKQCIPFRIRNIEYRDN